MSSLLLFLLLDVAGAEKALEANEPRKAIELLGDLANGDDPRANAVLGRAYYLLRDYGAAVEPFLIASDGLPEDKPLAREAAMACWGAARGNDQFARAYLDDALRMARRAEDKGLIAFLRKDSGDYEGALEGLRKLPDGLRVRTAIAECLQLLGHAEEAKQAYGRALSLAIERKDLLAAYRMAFAAERGGKLLQWLNKELESRPEDVWFRLYRGFTYGRMEIDDKAVKDLRFAIGKLPEDMSARMQLLSSLLRLGIREQRDEALAEAEQLARGLIGKSEAADRAGRDSLFWLASRAWLNRDVEKSCKLLKELFALDRTDKNIGLNFAAMARRLGRYDECERTYLKLLEAHEDDPDVLNDLGILRDGRGNRAGAIEAWGRVLKEDPEDMNALENLFTVAWEHGDKDKAERYLNRGYAVAKRQGGSLLVRWRWFADRLGWAPLGHGG